MNSRNSYIALAIVFLVSAAAIILLPVGDALRTLATIPAIGSLVGALLQISRDRIAYERSLLLLEAQNSFTIGATSHMASVAFDKHVLFCEEYATEMFEALTTLFTVGPDKQVLPHAHSLYKIRTRWAVWLTPEVGKQLERFEAALTKIGTTAVLAARYPGEDIAATIERGYSLFAEVVGFEEWKGEPISGELAVLAVIGKLRKVLGIDELTLLRSGLVKRALDNLKNSG